MKLKFVTTLFLLTTFSLASFSQNLPIKERANRASLSIRLANYTNETAKTLPVTMMSDIDSFSDLALTEKNDLELVKNVIKTLLILDASEADGGDPSRTAVITLSNSYQKHKALYNKALKKLETTENKKQFQEFKDIWSGKNSNL